MIHNNNQSKTFQSIGNVIETIKSSVCKSKFERLDLDHQCRVLEGLAIEIVSKEGTDSVLGEFVTPFVVDLNEIVSNQRHQHDFSFHSAIAKPYRMFIEILLVQCIKYQVRLLQPTIDSIIQFTGDIRYTIPRTPEFIEARFDYSCASQAAKLLNTNKKVWTDIVNSVLNIGSNAVGQNPFSLVSSIVDTVNHVQKQYVISPWYHQAATLQLGSYLIKTESDFTQILPTATITKYMDLGGKHSVVLAVILLNMVSRDDVELKVKNKAVEYLFKLLSAVDQSSITNDISKKLLPKDFKIKNDKYFSAFCLISFVFKREIKAKNENYLEYKTNFSIMLAKRKELMDDLLAKQYKNIDFLQQKKPKEVSVKEEENIILNFLSSQVNYIKALQNDIKNLVI
ncbi:hypothetical protein CYY_006225 [Polysphondylium violaceum]|uniref:Uncharacterized protein n=1 Tax=Polysphondylium violaceum TaxID=133409 RepID=A0A8J4PT08_9MYCE|nr:hypothetical protein CYY_006225 [Polysphondylium violaceum]